MLGLGVFRKIALLANIVQRVGGMKFFRKDGDEREGAVKYVSDS